MERLSEVITALQGGSIELRGEFFWGSNYTFLTMVNYLDQSFPAVYKPTRGVRPLWDFPKDSLAKREIAAFLISEALGWELVPPTIFRSDAPLGPGSMQMFIEHDPEYHYFNFRETHIQRLRPTVLFDVIINNADRKGSHILIDPQDHLWLIDHGVCFHEVDKLRTVIWDFINADIPFDLLSCLSTLREKLVPSDGGTSNLLKKLRYYLSESEIHALTDRVSGLLKSKRFPAPDSNRRFYPWPEI